MQAVSPTSYREIPLSFSVEMREANQTHFTLTDWPFPVIALIYYYHCHHHLHCLQLQTLQAELTL